MNGEVDGNVNPQGALVLGTKETRKARKAWFAVPVYRPEWEETSLVLVSGVTREEVEVLLDDAGYEVLFDEEYEESLHALVDRGDVQVLLIGTDTNPVLRYQVGPSKRLELQEERLAFKQARKETRERVVQLKKDVNAARAVAKVARAKTMAVVGQNFKCACGKMLTVQDVVAKRPCKICRENQDA